MIEGSDRDSFITMENASNWIVLAELLRPQGRKGELLAELHTDFPERFSEDTRVFLAKADFNGTAEQARQAVVSEFWLPLGKNQGRIVLKFTGIDSITDAESIAGLEVIVPREERLPLEDEANYISDLVGCTVYDGLTPIGIVDDVQFSTTPDGLRRLEEIAPMLILKSTEGEELLIPFAKDFLVSIDPEAKRIDMILPVGLVDVNR
jgi:16S rRNA processing protein RimM